MSKLEKLFDLVESENIEFFFANLSLMKKLGLYMNLGDKKAAIVIDYSIKNDKVKLTETLAEELGHHFTSYGDYSRKNNYSKKLEVAKCENKALKWACEYLISESELKALIGQNMDIFDISKACEVSEDFFIKRLEFLKKENKKIKINQKTLILDNLPYFYLY